MAEEGKVARGMENGGDQEKTSRGPGPRTVLVLGGGGMKGIAHIGVVKALEEAAIRPDAVIGTSIGALVGALVAGGLGWRELTEIARRLRRDDIVALNRRSLWLGGIRSTSVFEDRPFLDWMERVLPVRRFSELIMPLRVNATSLVSGEEVWFGQGCRRDIDLLQAIYASCALPVYFPPLRFDGDVLVDGGILNAFPLSQAAAWDAERVIGVDVGSDFAPPPEGFFEQGLVAIHHRVVALDMRDRRRETLARYSHLPDVYIRPDVGHVDTFDFERTQFLMEEGYRAAREALESLDGTGSTRRTATATPATGG
jgi:NTE family protein